MRNASLARGFTLIELMIVVAIVGILAAIAIPAYQDYIVRSKVSELLATVSQCKTAVAEYMTSKNTLPADLTASGCTTIPTKYGTGLDVTAGQILIAATADVGGSPPQTGLLLGLRPEPVAGTSVITAWDCTRATGGSTLEAKYLPAVCR